MVGLAPFGDETPLLGNDVKMESSPLQQTRHTAAVQQLYVLLKHSSLGTKEEPPGTGLRRWFDVFHTMTGVSVTRPKTRTRKRDSPQLHGGLESPKPQLTPHKLKTKSRPPINPAANISILLHDRCLR